MNNPGHDFDRSSTRDRALEETVCLIRPLPWPLDPAIGAASRSIRSSGLLRNHMMLSLCSRFSLVCWLRQRGS